MADEPMRRRQHVVSKFYLKYFATQSGQLSSIELPDRTFTQSVEDASVRKDYYTAIDSAGAETDAAERAFAEIEAPASESWRKVIEGTWPLPEIDRVNVAGWVALHLLRAAGVRNSMGELGSGLLQLQIMLGGRQHLREVLRDLGEATDDDSVDAEWVNLFRDPPEVGVHANHHLKHMADTMPKVAASLFDRWWVLTTFELKSLGTSDHPVAVVPNDRDTQLGLGTGIETADLILLPFTRRMSLTLARRDTLPVGLAGRDDAVQQGTAQIALWCNSVTSRNGRRFLFHHPDDSPFAGLPLPTPRERETGESGGDPWRFMTDADRQVLIDAGVDPPALEDVP